MTDSNSIEYYCTREQRERELAKAATDPEISAIHLEMAERYSQMSAALPRRAQNRPVLHMV